MFRFALQELKAHALRALNVPLRALAGAAFVVMAMAAIQYDEQIGPQMSRFSHGLDSVTHDFRTKLASFTL